ncbi:hypothetical protein [Streptosporangium fragile]
MTKAGPRRHNGNRPTSSTLTSAITTARVADDAPTVTGIAYPPAGRRTCWLAIVERCPHCGHAHAHRGSVDAPPSGPVTGGCHARYQLLSGDPLDAELSPERFGQYSAAITAARNSIAQRARAAANLATSPVGAIENVELLRAALHREVDQLLDAEADRHGPLLTIPLAGGEGR